MNKNLIDQLDETNARLLGAIELAQFELENGMYIEAKITLAMFIEEHKARLVAMSKPTGSADKRWMGNRYDGQTFIDPAYLRRLRLASRYIRRYAPLARLWENEKD